MYEIFYGIVKTHSPYVVFVSGFISLIITLFVVAFFPELATSLDFFGLYEYRSDYFLKKNFGLRIFLSILFVLYSTFLAGVAWFAWQNRNDI